MATNTIGKSISELRKQKGITQEELAKTVGVTPQAVSKWEGGGTPDVELLVPIADYFEVPIDRLFGRNINDYSDIKTEVAKYIAKEGSNKAIAKVFELCWVIERGIAGLTDTEPYNSLQAVIEKHKGKVHSQMLFDNGMTLMALHKELQYFLIMPEPECGWLKELGNKEDYLKLFKILSDTDILNTLYLLYGRDNKPFTPKLLEKEIGISSDRAKEILDILALYKLVFTSEIELDDEIQIVYNFKPNPSFIAVLSLFRELIQRPNGYYCYIGGRKRPYLSKGVILPGVVENTFS